MALFIVLFCIPAYSYAPTSAPAPPPPTVLVYAVPNLPHTPAAVTCPNCHSRVTTNVKYEPGTRTHFGALVLCLL